MIIAAEKKMRSKERRDTGGQAGGSLIRKRGGVELWPSGRRQAPGLGQKAVCCPELPLLNPLNRDTYGRCLRATLALTVSRYIFVQIHPFSSEQLTLEPWFNGLIILLTYECIVARKEGSSPLKILTLAQRLAKNTTGHTQC